MLKAAFLHDTEMDFLGGAELSNKAILDVSEEHGIIATYDCLRDFKKTKQLIRESDFVIVNSTYRCDYEFLLIDFLTSCGKPYVKWEHDYNFCAKRTALCFAESKVRNCCDSGRFSAHRKFFAQAKLSVFVSPMHYKLHHEIYGDALQPHLILAPPIDVAHVKSLPKRKNSVCFIGDLSQKKGGHNLVDFARDNPNFKVDVYGNNVIARELPFNILLKGKLPNEEVLHALSESEYFFFKPVWPEPGGRIAAEAFLSGCKTISNGNIGFHSHPFYPAYQDEARKAIQDAPHQFWEKVKEAINIPEKKQRWKNVLVYKSFGGLGDFLFVIPAIHKIAEVSEKISVCVPFVLYDVVKKQLPQYEIYQEDYINKANLDQYDKIIDLKNYPSFRKDPGNEHQMAFPSYRRVKQHAIKHYLDGVATLHPEIDNSYNGYPFFKSSAKTKGKYFTVHPGAGFLAKYWPAEKYGALIEMLLNTFEDIECRLILGPDDPKAEELFKKIPARVSIPKGKLEVIAEEISGALFHVGNDSGITHLAGAFNIPTVTIHGPTGPGTWMSFAEQKEVIWGKQGVCNIACNYDVAVSCAHRICLNSVSAQRVMKHVLKLLQRILPKQESVRFIFNPEATVQEYKDAYVIQINDKELLIEFSEVSGRKLFEKLLENRLQQIDFSGSFLKLVDVLIQNELLFKISRLPDNISNDGLEKKNVEVTIISHVLKRDSIGRHGIIFGEMLHDAFAINGIPTRQPSPDGIETNLFQKLTTVDFAGKLALFTDVLWHNKNSAPYKRIPNESQVKVCYSMFESSSIPEEWVNIINSDFDGVLVPDQWLLQVYKDCGVEKPVKVLPLGCYLKDFLDYPLKQKPNQIFTFGISSAVWMRKNIIGVINAFQLAFPGMKEKVKLKIHSRYGYPPEVRKIESAINGDPRIEFFIETLSDNDYLNFMTSLDAYVMLSTGEGFSVTPREAMALGLPVILSYNTAHATICDSGLVDAVPTEKEFPAYYEVFNRSIGNFFMPDTMKAVAFMKAMYENRESLYSDAAKRRNWAAQYDLNNLKTLYIETIGKILREGF